MLIKVTLTVLFFYCLSFGLLNAQELRGIDSKASNTLLVTHVVRIGSGYDDGVFDGTKKSKIIKRSIKATTTTIGLILGANPIGIVAGNVGVYGLRRKLKKETGCSNLYKNCCFSHKGIIEIRDGIIYCGDGEIMTDCNCNN